MLGISVVLMLWAGVGYKSIAEWRDARHEAERTDKAFAMMFEENVLRAVGEIDKSLLYMRRTLETHSPAELYGTLANTKDLLSDIIVQVAIVDANGIMRATNVGPQPPPPTDLSDRPHFKVHLGTAADILYIGDPLIGRASGRMSVQFSRRFRTPAGSFGGVVVASLDPYHFTHFLDQVDLSSRAAISLVGDDGIVRSDAGADDGVALGASIVGTPLYDLLRAGRNGSFEVRGQPGQDSRVVTVRKVKGQPLWVLVSVPHSEIYRDARAALTIDMSVAIVLTLLMGLTVGKILQIEAKRSEAHASFLRLALQDPLTELPNRRVFHRELETIANVTGASPGGAEYAVLFLDIDRFKFVNDTLGHAIGDRLLVEISRRLSSLLGLGHMLARLGGDEFAILIPNVTEHASVEKLGLQICSLMAQPFDIERHQIRSGVSIGIAVGPADGANAEEILIAADLALYAVKARSRGTYQYFDRSMSERISERRQIESELRAALDEGNLELHYQPFLTLKTGQIAGFEALARWQHPTRGQIPPSLFISVAEECGLIHALGEWALTEACRRAVTWPPNMKIAVNVSPIQFVGPDLVTVVGNVLDRTSLPASRLELEITEQTLLENGERTMRTLTSLKALGLGITMDDFGTGYSSLNYLSNFPFDRIKVDRSFVARLGQSKQQTAIVRAVIDIADSSGMATTAEGVETADQRDLLAALGCGEVQGYFFSRPVPISDVPKLIDGWEKTVLRAA